MFIRNIPFTALLLCSLQLHVNCYAQSIDVKGKIVNEDGAPVAAVITVKGTNVSVVANMNGEFVLAGIDEQSTLMVHSNSTEPREVRVNGRQELIVTVRNYTKNNVIIPIPITPPITVKTASITSCMPRPVTLEKSSKP